MSLINAIYTRCSKEIVSEFMNIQYDSVTEQKFNTKKRNIKTLVEMIYCFTDTINQEKMDKINQMKHKQNFQKK